ncbi:MAG: hypothetical protein ACJAS9_003751 [Polaribacter sp.]|jgi:hypothetical protein
MVIVLNDGYRNVNVSLVLMLNRITDKITKYNVVGINGVLKSGTICKKYGFSLRPLQE